MEDTIFSKIIKREIPANIRHETDEFLAFDDINPQAKTHVLFITKKPIESIIDLNEEEKDHELVGRLILEARNWAKAEGITGYRLKFHCGKAGGQEVFHLHMHLLSNQG